MKQTKTSDNGENKIAKPSISKVGTMLGAGALAVLTIGTVSVFALTGKNIEPQKDTKATEISNTVEQTYTSLDTVELRKASINQYEIAQSVTEETTTAKTTTASSSKAAETTKAAEKITQTKLDNVTMYAEGIVNIRKSYDENSEIVAMAAPDDSLVVTAKTSNGWYAVSYGNYAGYAATDSLTSEKPESVIKAETEATTKATAASEQTKAPAQTTASNTQAQTTTKKPSTTTASAAKPSSSSDTVISYTDEEYDMFCYVVQGEVGNCTENYKLAVANVIINRVKSNQFPDSIKGVLTANNQFTAINGYYNNTTPPNENTIECVNRALRGEDNSNGATFYYSPDYCSGTTAAWFESLCFCLEFDNARFFKNW